MQTVYFLTFADTRMAPTMKSIVKQAKQSKFFDVILAYDERKLGSFMKSHKQYIRDYPRGFGYWLWKPYLILETLKNKLQEGDILVYLDSGCEINISARKRWEEYKEMLKVNSILLYDHLHSFEDGFTKYSVLEHFNVLDDAELLGSRQLMATIQMIRKNKFSLDLIEKWYNICEEHKTTLLCDLPSDHEELPTFKQHCHDQSIFSVLCKTIDRAALDNKITDGQIRVLPMIESFPYPRDWSLMAPYPFWARHRKIYKPMSILERAVNKFKRICHDILKNG